MFRGFIAGLLAGAALGLLFAPQRGEETRAQVQSRLNSLQQEAQSRAGTLREKSGPMIDQVRQNVTSTLKSAQSALQSAAAQAQQEATDSANETH
jgi:gas vesicle protein